MFKPTLCGGFVLGIGSQNRQTITKTAKASRLVSITITKLVVL
jgi:hypothetical protein